MKFFDFPTEEELEELHKKELERLKSNPNNISYWFPKIKDCGIDVPKTTIIPIPDELETCFYMEHQKEDQEKIYQFVKENIYPIVKDYNYQVFIKNGCFSNKFNFKTCAPNINSDFGLTDAIIQIQYTSLLYETDGYTELAIRELIHYNNEKIPTIYKGMPLRPEFRVFYDFDNRKVLYCVNYWDWNYCHEQICKNTTDKIVYESYYNHILTIYNSLEEQVKELVDNSMKNVDLTDKWSVDILYDEENNKFWLIDMAKAEKSAYWKDKR